MNSRPRQPLKIVEQTTAHFPFHLSPPTTTTIMLFTLFVLIISISVCSVNASGCTSTSISIGAKCSNTTNYECHRELPCGYFSAVKCADTVGYVLQQFKCNETNCEPIEAATWAECCELSSSSFGTATSLFKEYSCDSTQGAFLCDVMGCNVTPSPAPTASPVPAPSPAPTASPVPVSASTEDDDDAEFYEAVIGMASASVMLSILCCLAVRRCYKKHKGEWSFEDEELYKRQQATISNIAIAIHKKTTTTTEQTEE